MAAAPTHRRLKTANLVAAVLIGVAILLCALVIPADKVVLRAFACLAYTELAFKQADYARCVREGRVNSIPTGEYLWFLIPIPALVVVFADAHRRRALRPDYVFELLRVLLGVTTFGTACAVLHWSASVSLFQRSFVFDHTAKLFLFVVAIEAVSQTLLGIEHALGFETRPLVRGAFFSSTVGEFWMRYNTRIHEWLRANVFRPAGGAKEPIRSVFFTFLFSAMHHELGFAIATSRIDGYQFAFFMLQAPAVLASRKCQRVARRLGMVGACGSRLLTVVWLALSSVLFFHGVDRVFPFFYASTSWLP